jgi:hypothetical protein
MKKFAGIVMAATLTAGVLAASVSQAKAEGGRGAAFGLGLFAGAAAVGIMSAAERDAYYRAHCHPGPERCRWVPRRCFFDEEIGERVCHGGQRECWRERWCD